MGIIKRSKVIEKGYLNLKQSNSSVQNEQKPLINEQVQHRAETQIVAEDDFDNSQEVNMENVEAQAQELLEQAQSQAQEIVQNAQNEASQIREEAEKEAAEIKERIKEEAIDEGKREGEEKVKEYVEEAFSTLNSAIDEKSNIIKAVEGEIARLSIKIAEQIIRSEVVTNKEVVMNIIAEAINRVSDRDNLIIKVNREDLDYVKANKDKISGIVDGIKNLTILEDTQVEEGGCVIETNLGFVDARISTKISLIEQAFKKVASSDGN